MASSDYEAKDKMGDLPTSGHNELPSGVGLLNYTDYKSNSSNKINRGNIGGSFQHSMTSQQNQTANFHATTHENSREPTMINNQLGLPEDPREGTGI